MKLSVFSIVIEVLFGLLFFNSCSKSGNHKREGRYDYTFELAPQKEFLLDSMTTQEVNYMQVVNGEKMAIYNLPTNSICFFDISSGNEIKKISIHKTGPNAVIGIQGFFYQSEDSIWLYRSWQQELVLINSHGEIIDKKELKDKLYPAQKQKYSVSPFPLTDLPIQKCGDLLVMQGMNGPEVKDGLLPASTILYNISLNTLSLENPYPAIYGENINERWGAFSYRAVPYTLNDTGEMVVSFPADDSISVYSLKTKKYQRHFAGYSRETDVKAIAGDSKSDLQRHYLEQYQYAGIFYDKFHNLYYRLVLLPIFDYDIIDKNTQFKPLSVIILDASFNKVGEYDMGRADCRYRNSFVSEEGLHINVYSDDDDYLRFITLKLVENEKE